LAAAVPAPDTADMDVEDRMVPADPDVPVRIYRPHLAQAVLVWLHGGGSDKITASWGHYLGSAPATPYAAPARAADLSGLPPAYIATAEFCPNRDEDITYAVRLLQAGVSVELHQWPGTFHGSQAILSAEVSQRQNAELAAALRHVLAG
jgi:acetyl esterase